MKLSGELKIMLGAALFAFIPICVKLDPASSLVSLIFGRLLVACIILTILNRTNKKFFIINKKEALHLIIWAILMLLAMIFYFYAISTIGAAMSSALLGLQPLIIVLLSIIFIKETITRKTFIASILTLIGVIIISDLSNFSENNLIMGQVAAILSAIFLGFVFIYQKKFLLKLDTQKTVFYQSLFQLPFLLPLVILSPPTISYNFIWAILLLGIFATIISYGLIYSGVKSVSIQKIGVLQSVEYVIPVFLGLLFYNEQLGYPIIIGTTLIITASILVQISISKKKSSSIEIEKNYKN
jgi:drug/metabolite transporter (DMT)-like permease